MTGKVIGMPAKPTGDALPMSAKDAATSLGYLYAIHELAVALNAGRFSSLEDLTAAVNEKNELRKHHLMRAGVTVEWCECGAIGGSPCDECLGGPSPWNTD